MATQYSKWDTKKSNNKKAKSKKFIGAVFSQQLHVMARKGDSVAATMETLMSLRFRQGNGNKVYSGNVTNGKDFLPIHIAAMSTRCPQNILRILRNDYEQSLYGRTSDGSLPLHLVRNIFLEITRSRRFYLAPHTSTRQSLFLTKTHTVWFKGEEVTNRINREDGKKTFTY